MSEVLVPGDARPRPGRGHQSGAQGYALPGPSRAAATRPHLSSNSTDQPKFAAPAIALPRCTVRAETGGQQRKSRGGGRAAPAQMPLFVCTAPSSRHQADTIGACGPRRPGSPEPACSRGLPTTTTIAPPPPARPRAPACVPRLRPSHAAPALLPDCPAVAPPRGWPSPAQAGPGTHLGVPARPRESASCGLQAGTRSKLELGAYGRGCEGE